MVFVAAEALGGVVIVPFSFSAGTMEERDARGGMVAGRDRPATGHSIWHHESWLQSLYRGSQQTGGTLACRSTSCWPS
jgi:hypothetical protein